MCISILSWCFEQMDSAWYQKIDYNLNEYDSTYIIYYVYVSVINGIYISIQPLHLINVATLSKRMALVRVVILSLVGTLCFPVFQI